MLRPVPSTFDVVKERTPSLSHPITLHLAPFAIMPMQEIKLDIIYTCKNGCLNDKRHYTSQRLHDFRINTLCYIPKSSRVLHYHGCEKLDLFGNEMGTSLSLDLDMCTHRSLEMVCSATIVQDLYIHQNA